MILSLFSTKSKPYYKMKLRVQVLIVIILEFSLHLPSCQVFAFFCPSSSARKSRVMSPCYMSPMMGGNSNDGDEEESRSEDSSEKKRMENVRRLQKTFYQSNTNDRGATSNGDGDDNDDEPQPRLEEESGIVTNLPLCGPFASAGRIYNDTDPTSSTKI
mmetsp:Transcript_31725/g.36411  ORF Transcript_31725/g.36411 Transcript_31725/m.36411 type:complete len:159 (+) Transcript_31725:71-547(+)